MCGRFTLTASPEALARALGVSEVPELAPRYNVAPGQDVAAVRLEEGRRRWCLLCWGLVPSWARDPKLGARLINARAETVDRKPSFRAAFRRRRCLIPADGFFEWQSTTSGKQPFYIRRRDGAPFAFAGLWEAWGERLETCTILTTEANALVRPLHARMPVILAPEQIDLWLDPQSPSERLKALFQPCPAELLIAYPVSSRVNSPRHDDPACIVPQA